MRKSAIVSVVFAGVFIIVGLALMCGTLCSFNFQPYYGGYRMMTSGLDAIGGYLVARMLLGGALFLGGIMLLCLSSYLFMHPAATAQVKKPCGCAKPQEREQPKPVESVEVVKDEDKAKQES